MTLPTHVFLGPDKTGSTWLFNTLNNHPEAFVPAAKDLYFFDKYYGRGLQWYEDHFAKGRVNNVRVDISHDYLMSSEAPERIKKDIPEASLFMIARNPIDRAVSHYQYLKKSGLVKSGFLEAIDKRPDIIDNGLYSKHIANYEKAFGDGCVKIFNFEDLKRSPQNFASQIFSYMEISNYQEVIAGKERGASDARSHYLSLFVKKWSVMARDLGMENVIGVLKNNKIINKMLYKELPSSYASAIKSCYSEYLMENYFQEEVLVMKKTYGVDLGCYDG